MNLFYKFKATFITCKKENVLTILVIGCNLNVKKNISVL